MGKLFFYSTLISGWLNNKENKDMAELLLLDSVRWLRELAALGYVVREVDGQWKVYFNSNHPVSGIVPGIVGVKVRVFRHPVPLMRWIMSYENNTPLARREKVERANASLIGWLSAKTLEDMKHDIDKWNVGIMFPSGETKALSDVVGGVQ